MSSTEIEGQLRIDPDGGTIWFNGLKGCILRIQGLGEAEKTKLKRFTRKKCDGMVDIRLNKETYVSVTVHH